MQVFKLSNKKVESIEPKPFKLEREIQDLIENNTEAFFSLEFIRSEFTIGNYRIDSLCYDDENNSFVIIEYKKGSSYSVIDQGYTYLQLLLNNKSDFLLTLSQHKNKVLKLENIDWSQSKIIFISQAFNTYQKDSVNFKNLPFELWEINKFANNTAILIKHQTDSKESIDTLSNPKNKNLITSVSREVKVVDEEYHTSKSNKDLVLKWEELKERFNAFENVQISSKKKYMSLNLNYKAVAYFKFRKSVITIGFSRGTLHPDDSTSKNYFYIDDPKGISYETFRKWKSGSKGTYYNVPFTKNSDIDYMMFLIKQKYNNLINR